MRSSVLVSTPLLAFAALAAGALVGCTSPREKDCKVVMPLVEESQNARIVGVMDGGTVQPTFAERPRRTASSLRALTLDDPQMKSAVTALAEAHDRFATAMAAIDHFVSAMKLEAGSPPMAFNFIDGVRPHVERVMKRCGIVMRTEQQRALPDCIALERALEQCVTPAKDDTTAEEQLLTCATAVGKVHSEDAPTNESIQQLSATLRSLEPVTRNIGAPAKEVIRAARQHSGEISKQTVARTEVERAEGTIRGLCQSGSGARP